MNTYAICIDNRSNPASLIVGKVYRRLSDRDAEAHDLMRIVDEDASEPDGYLYPAEMQAPIEVPAAVERLLFADSRQWINRTTPLARRIAFR